MDFHKLFRLFFFLAFSISIMLLWDSWQRTQQPIARIAPAAVPQTVVPTGTAPSVATTVSPEAITAATQQKIESGQKITVKTDYLTAEINTIGGDLRRLEFLHQRDSKDKNKPFVLLQKRGEHTYIAQTGLLGTGLPTHNTTFTAEANEYILTEGKDTIEVRLHAKNVVGANVTKIYVFHRDGYLVDIGYEIENTGTSTITPSAYFQLVRDSSSPEGTSMFLPTYTGTAIYTEKDKFQKVGFPDIESGSADHSQIADNGWAGMLQHYFVAAWLPKDKVQREFYTKPLENDLYSVGVIFPVAAISPGQSTKVSMPLYAGPAQTSLDKIAPGLGLTVDYGWLTIISNPLFWLLAYLHGWVYNWGVAIILLTVLIKLLFFPLSAASYRSMGKMRVVAPKLEKIKQQCGNDRERLHKAMMELYKTEKINPLGGCLPMIVQIPVFIALYWAILASVELRYAPFFGWITDLSVPDPYYVLPLIMGATMIIQSKLNPVPPDPLQAKLMKLLPIVFSVVFFFFPAGLVLYSIVNNILSIIQQWYITRGLEANVKGAAKA
ncbi:membrane protein insertase YidC [Candidatus Nitrotoga sp. M5]|uniref:membrane protein insertase YidC n=1 Tax=Candidatus Nitrotoga sp. M5 TaxID=2890409 RepID=UPI001EF27C7E|nr:membrane protein insertase YidC [Candidatus Nitrotoga sp. M5]CAH1385670.1 Membrane protein insertase YidC [Candidatus Nitrotoga sp. M5]